MLSVVLSSLHCFFASRPNCFHTFCSWLRACVSSTTHLSCVGLMPPSNWHSRAISSFGAVSATGMGCREVRITNNNRQVSEHLVLRVRDLQSPSPTGFKSHLGKQLLR